jgi:hypothetical protein
MKLFQPKYFGLICLVVLIFCRGGSILYAQSAAGHAKNNCYWVNFGFGGSRVHGGLGDSDGGISVGITMSLLKGMNLFSVRGVDSEEFKLDLWGDSGPPASVWDIGALYGLAAKASFGMASISGGVGIVGLSDNEGKSSYCVGIPLESQLFWTPFSFLGLGLSGFANLNAKKSFAGVLLCLQIGLSR